MRRWSVLLTGLLALGSSTASAQETGGSAGAEASTAAASVSACVTCHADPDMFEIDDVQVVTDYLDSVHAEVGLTCTDCHGGNDDPELAEDFESAMDPEHAENPYKGVPARTEIPEACGTCHSDLAYMRRFRPDARVDQETEYWTSGHGIALKGGDINVATCTDCHGVHDIRRSDDAESHVYPKNVATTCARCHADADRMSGYTLVDGRPLPTDQYARWKRSVHAASMFDREDLTAPTCNDCHGNHGAMPPGLDSITYVCGQCHGREASMFRESAKQELWELHNENLEMVGFESCAGCHEEPEPQAAITTMYHFGECTSCHGNHGIVRPTLAFFAPFDRTPCAFCHEGHPAEGSDDHVEIAGRYDEYIEARDTLVEEAKQAEQFAEDRFNYLVDKALELPAHGGDPGDHSRVRFERLFEKFRIGKTYYEYMPGDGAEPVRVELQRCTWCHAQAALLEDASDGHRVGQEIAEGMIDLMALTTRAEASMAAASRGGIELRDAMLDIDQAVDTQIDLQVLVHRFRTDGEFADSLAEGRAFAEAAIAAGEEAQAELRFRRLGLLVFLFFVVLVLVALGMKIRQN